MAEDKNKKVWRAELPDVEDDAEEARLRRKWEKEQVLKNAQRERRLKEQKKRLRAIVVLAALLVLVITVIFVVIFQVFLGNPGKYQRANKLLEKGAYSEAIVAFREIVDYKDAREKMNEAIGLEAQKLVGSDTVYYATSESAPWLKISERGALSFDEKKYEGDWENVIIPDVFDGVLVSEIAEKGFSHCDKITGITLSECIRVVGPYAFLGCDSLEMITLPERLTAVRDSAFEDCASLSEIRFGGNVSEIGMSAFAGCTSLTSVDLPDSVESIGARAFNGCSALKDVSLGSAVKSIGSYAFSACERFELLTFRGTLADWQALGVSLERTGLATVTITCENGEVGGEAP